ncbi:YceI family protein [Fulvivirgaceae bacterium PWU4]|uniref:YceI family protein n=1 Tax=Chryseosolibacter histidini TaxID=2782349 RepID=A0AAP2DKR4_9BACT|nr:YceI family protein [Chryseosolibacter histidini]MBT1697123.1 YceI family protein [Chryseosolibacter histidini]
MMLKAVTLYFFAALYPITHIGAQNKPAATIPSLVSFSILNAGAEVKGTMEISNVDIHFNPKDPAQSTISASADPATIDTGISIRDEHLKRSDYFNVEKHPEIRLQCTGFRKVARRFIGYFDLTIKGITKPVIIYFTCTSNNNNLLLRGTFDLNRLDYNLGEKSIILDEQVKVRITFLTQ